VNPRIGSDLQYGRKVEEEKTAGVVRNHEGGTRMGIGVPIPKVVRGDAETRSRTPPGVGLLGWYDGGAIFGQPHERKPGAVRENGWSGRKDRNASGKSAPRSGGSRVPVRKCWRADRSKVLEDRSAATCSKVGEGSSERPGSRDFDRILPPAGGTCRM